MSGAGRNTAAAAVLAVDELTVRYGATVAVDRACLSVPAGGISALVGPSGCGKTSLLRAVAGFGEIAGGTIHLAGRLVAGAGRWTAPEERRVGMVFQEGALFPHLTVRQNVLYGLKGRPDAATRAAETLALVRLRGLEGRYPDELSGGQRQRVALARALAPAPQLGLLDEPFANLDETLRDRVREEVRAILLQAGATAMLVTHDQQEALSIADHVAVMMDGQILQVGPPHEIYHRPADVEVALFLGDGQLVPCTVAAGRAHCVLGSVPTDAAEGPGRLFLRPEDLQWLPEGDAEGAPGTSSRHRFYGHDRIDEIALEGTDTVLRVRSLASAAPPAGARVRLALRPGSYRVFA